MPHPDLGTSKLLIKGNNRQDGWKRTSWGEAMRPLISSTETNGLFSLFDFEAPAHFGPPRHHHLDDVEAITVTSGRLAVWTTHGAFLAEPGDTVHVPRRMEHAWRALGDEPVRLRIVMAPGRLETFFDLALAQRLAIDNGPGLAAAAEAAGIVVTGPPLTDAEARLITVPHLVGGVR